MARSLGNYPGPRAVGADRLLEAVAAAVAITGTLKAADKAVARHEGNSAGALIKAVKRARRSGRASEKVVWQVRRFVEAHEEGGPPKPVCTECGHAIRKSKVDQGWMQCDRCTFGSVADYLGITE